MEPHFGPGLAGRRRNMTGKPVSKTETTVVKDDVKEFNILRDFAPLSAVARDLRVCERTLRRRLHRPDGWPFLLWGGRIYLHIPTVRKLIEAEVSTPNPRRGAK
jgi:hypothetical protein